MVQAKSGNRYNRPKKQKKRKKKKKGLKRTQVTQPKNHNRAKGNEPSQSQIHRASEESEEEAMADNREILPPQYDVNAKWDACIDLTVRRFVYSTLGGAVGGLLLFSQFFLLPSLSVFYLASVKLCDTFARIRYDEFGLND
jgi:hypothetical protein